MDMRYKAFLLHEAEAVRRQQMARTALAIRAGFGDKAGFNKFITNLELHESIATIQKDEALVTKVLSLLRGRRK